MNSLGAAWNAFELEDFESAERLFRRARLEESTRAEARGGLVYVYARTGRFGEARDECQAMQLEAQATGDTSGEYAALHQLGVVERLAGNFERALAVFGSERELIARLESPPLAVSANAFEQGVLNAKLERFETARDWYRVALEAADLAGDDMAQACALRGLAEITVNPMTRKALFLQSAAAFEQAGDTAGALEIQALLKTSVGNGD